MFCWKARNRGPGGSPQVLSGFWYNEFWKYVTLIWETILMALTANAAGDGAGGDPELSGRAQHQRRTPWSAPLRARVLEFCRGVPEILFALVVVFWVGIGPLAGVLAITIHAAGALGKLFSEVVENASMRPVDGMKAVGGSWFEQMRYGILPQVLPNFTSYALWRFEINVRASAVVGFVGAGGIGTELSHTISFYSDDRVTAVLLLVVLLVTVIDLLSERARHTLIGKEALK